MNDRKNFKRGDQIVYNCYNKTEFGFVTGTNKKYVFCRFWSATNIGSLRTLANSEGCRTEYLNKTGENVPPVIIQAWLKYIEKNQEITK